MPRVAQRQVILSDEMLTWALQGLEREIAETRKRLETLQAQASALRARVRTPAPAAVSAPAAPPAVEAVPRKRKVMSPEARRRISLAMKRRWAERKRAEAAAKK